MSASQAAWLRGRGDRGDRLLAARIRESAATGHEQYHSTCVRVRDPGECLSHKSFVTVAAILAESSEHVKRPRFSESMDLSTTDHDGKRTGARVRDICRLPRRRRAPPLAEHHPCGAGGCAGHCRRRRRSARPRLPVPRNPRPGLVLGNAGVTMVTGEELLANESGRQTDPAEAV
jgi:hypothetical protein